MRVSFSIAVAVAAPPVVLFSPAQDTTRLFYSAIAQTIASSGYIVVTIDAPYDVDIVEYPDGSLALANATVANAATTSTTDLAVKVGAKDASFVLDQLTNKTVIANLIPGFTRSLNVSKVAMFGHSLGKAGSPCPGYTREALAASWSASFSKVPFGAERPKPDSSTSSRRAVSGGM